LFLGEKQDREKLAENMEENFVMMLEGPEFAV